MKLEYGVIALMSLNLIANICEGVRVGLGPNHEVAFFLAGMNCVGLLGALCVWCWLGGRRSGMELGVKSGVMFAIAEMHKDAMKAAADKADELKDSRAP